MSRVDTLVAAMDSLAVKFLEFTRVVRNDNNKVAVFFEGEDEKYYSIRLATGAPGVEWGGVRCGGKRKVIQMRERIRQHSEYGKSRCIFFVDADFDDNTDLHDYADVYVTPGYSVENFYISDSAFQRILSAEFDVTPYGESSACFEKAFDSFTASKRAYLDAVEDFNCWLRSCRILERTGALTGRLNLNNLEFSSLVNVGLGVCVSVYDADNIEALFPDMVFNVVVDKESSRAILASCSHEASFRGKQQLEFMRVFLTLLKTDRCKKNGRTIFAEKGNVRMNLTKANCLSELSQYADTPKCLLAFLDTYKRGLDMAAIA